MEKYKDACLLTYELEELIDGLSEVIADKESLYADIIPGLKRFSIAYCAGSFKMKVEPNRIAVDFYGGDSIEPTKTFVLR